MKFEGDTEEFKLFGRYLGVGTTSDGWKVMIYVAGKEEGYPYEDILIIIPRLLGEIRHKHDRTLNVGREN